MPLSSIRERSRSYSDDRRTFGRIAKRRVQPGDRALGADLHSNHVLRDQRESAPRAVATHQLAGAIGSEKEPLLALLEKQIGEVVDSLSRGDLPAL